MVYNSFVYLLLFLPAAVLIYHALPSPVRFYVIPAASILFLSCFGPAGIFFVLAEAAVLYLCALYFGQKDAERKQACEGLDRKAKKAVRAQYDRKKARVLKLGLFILFGILFATKYLDFFAGIPRGILHAAGIQRAFAAPELPLPLGVSFYTLSGAGYLIDVYMGDIKPEKNYGKVLAFLCFFPTITEGPICRFGPLSETLFASRRITWEEFCFGLQRILFGLFQKVVLADQLGNLIREIFGHYRSYNGAAIAAGILMYTVQIYMDFCGCIHIAAGSAELFGIRLPENFRQPFFAQNVDEFWRRWHITLGAWLKDYVFYPVSLSRPLMELSKKLQGKIDPYYAALIPTSVSLFAVWFGNGLWHGAQGKYIFYGLYYYIIMITGKLLTPLFRKFMPDEKSAGRGVKLFRILRTWLFVAVGMTIFRADTLRDAAGMLSGLFAHHAETAGFSAAMNAAGITRIQLLLVFCGVLLMFVIGYYKEQGTDLRQLIAARPLAVRYAVYLCLLMAVIVLGAYGTGFGANDFLYAKF